MSAHVESLKNYLTIFTVLMVLLLLTVFAASFDLDHIFGGLNLAVAMFISIVQALLVVMFFMHLRFSSRLTWAFAFGGFIWLGLMLSLTCNDYLTRADSDASNYVPPTPRQGGSFINHNPEQGAARDLKLAPKAD